VLGRKELEYGKESLERSIQRQREAGVLQALFFSRNMVPDTPNEPDPEAAEEHQEPKIIPLEDVSCVVLKINCNYEKHSFENKENKEIK